MNLILTPNPSAIRIAADISHIIRSSVGINGELSITMTIVIPKPKTINIGKQLLELCLRISVTFLPAV